MIHPLFCMYSVPRCGGARATEAAASILNGETRSGTRTKTTCARTVLASYYLNTYVLPCRTTYYIPTYCEKETTRIAKWLVRVFVFSSSMSSGGGCALWLLLSLERNVLDVEVHFGFLLQRHRVEAEPLERLHLPLVVVHLAVVQVDVLRGEDAV